MVKSTPQLLKIIMALEKMSESEKKHLNKLMNHTPAHCSALRTTQGNNSCWISCAWEHLHNTEVYSWHSQLTRERKVLQMHASFIKNLFPFSCSNLARCVTTVSQRAVWQSLMAIEDR